MKSKQIKAAAAILSAAVVATAIPQIAAFGYGETDASSTLNKETKADSGFASWNKSTWKGKEANDSGKIMLTPGETEDDLNFAWYSKEKKQAAVRVSTKSDMSDARVYDATVTDIDRKNRVNTYKAANHVEIKNYFKAGETYYYQYTDDKSAGSWSETYTYTPKSSESFTAILAGDPQIGASGDNDGKLGADAVNENIAADTYNWTKTLTQATKQFPNAAFVLSAGDQINFSSADSADTTGIRESEYAGYTYSSILRSLPVATTIGNHESLGNDYKWHFNNPNSSANLGATNSGCDYYFSYGDVLFISINSNNRNVAEHDALLKKAVASHKDAKWRVVMFHHDIYGSGEPHSDTDGANLRAIFAPLMDKYNIDVALTGHDHTYSRSYLLEDGTAINYGYDSATNPEGTLYITAGSASGSKFYKLNQTRQYYIAERTNAQLPSYSAITFDGDSIKFETYDYNGNKYANDYTLIKTKTKTSVKDLYTQATGIKKSAYTADSYSKVKNAAAAVKGVMDWTAIDKGAAAMTKAYDSSLDTAGPKDPVDYYGYAQDKYKQNNTSTLVKGFSTLLDKTLYDGSSIVSGKQVSTVKTSLEKAIKSLKKVSAKKTTTKKTSNKTTSKKTATKTTTKKTTK